MGLVLMGRVKVLARRLLTRGALGGKPGGGLLLGRSRRAGILCTPGLCREEGGGVWEGRGGEEEEEEEEDLGFEAVGGGVGTLEAVCLGWGGKGRLRELWRGGLGVVRGVEGLGGGEERTGAAVVNSLCV